MARESTVTTNQFAPSASTVYTTSVTTPKATATNTQPDTTIVRTLTNDQDSSSSTPGSSSTQVQGEITTHYGSISVVIPSYTPVSVSDGSNDSDSDGSSGGGTNTGHIIAGVLVPVAIIILSLMFRLYRRRRRHKDKHDKTKFNAAPLGPDASENTSSEKREAAADPIELPSESNGSRHVQAELHGDSTVQAPKVVNHASPV